MHSVFVVRVFLFLLSVSVGKMEAVLTSSVNLTAITWKHAVNSKDMLNDALNSDINFIEADIVLGTLDGDPSKETMPVMGHPPINHSDITLQQFLQKILDFNNEITDKNKMKGVKLDFKSIDVFQSSLDMLTQLWESMNYPVWINADILAGPVNNTETIPVDPVEFFKGCKRLSNAVLSIGWTTRWGSDFSVGSYSRSNINDMVSAIKTSKINESNHKITFPVRAGIAAHSLDNLHELSQAINQTNEVTLTVWSSEGDNVDIDLLRQLIFSFGIDRVYVDVPSDLANELDLGNGSGRAASLIRFGIINLVMFFTSLLLSRSYF